MFRIISGKRYFWLMSYIDKSEAVDRARRHRHSSKRALARVIRSRKGFYEVWAS